MRTQKCHISGEHIASFLEVIDTSISKLKKTMTYTFIASNPQLKSALLIHKFCKIFVQ